MELIPKVNDLLEIDHYVGVETHNGITTKTIVAIEEELFHVDEEIKRGSEVIYQDSYIIDKNLVKELNKLI